MAGVNEIERELLRLVRATPAGQAAGGLDRVEGSAAINLSTLQPSAAPPADPAAAPVSPGGSPMEDLVRELDALKRQMSVSEETTRRQSDELAKYARAVTENAQTQTGRSNVGAAAEDALSAFRGAGGLGVLGSPLAGLISRLFRRRSNDDVAAPLPIHSLPASIREELALPAEGSASGLTAAGYRGDGLPRAMASPAAPSSGPAGGGGITIQVQTMDSRSFLDNSDRIAQAVREAMLNSHSLNDVIGEM